MVKSKPIARQRVEIHSEDDIEAWFERYEDALQRRGITDPGISITWTNQELELG